MDIGCVAPSGWMDATVTVATLSPPAAADGALSGEVKRAGAEGQINEVDIFLLKEGVTPDQALEHDGEQFSSVPIPADLDFSGVILAKVSGCSPPHWRRFVERDLGDQDGPDPDFSEGCLVVVSTNDRLFAVPFGPAHSWIDRKQIVEGFGKAVVRSAVHPELVHSTAWKELFAANGERTAPEPSGQAHNGSEESGSFDDQGRPVSGIPQDEAFARHVVGADGLHIDTEISLPQLGGKCRDALKHYLKHSAHKRDAAAGSRAATNGGPGSAEDRSSEIRSQMAKVMGDIEFFRRHAGESTAEMLDAAGAADRLEMPESVVLDWIEKNMLLAWEADEGETVIPAEQILGPGKVLPHVPELVEIISSHVCVWAFISQEYPFTEKPMRPLDKLKQGDFEEVRGFALGYGTDFT